MSEQPAPDPAGRPTSAAIDTPTGTSAAGGTATPGPIPPQPGADQAGPAISAPTGLTATPVPGGPTALPAISLAWTVNGAAAARPTWCLDRSTDPRFTKDLTIIRSREPAGRYVDDTVVPDLAYSYRVRAEAAGAWSAWSGTATAVVHLPAPAGLRAVVPVAAPLRVELAWTGQSLAAGAEVQRAVNPTFTAGVVTVARLDGVTCVDDGVSESTTYYYRVRSTLRGSASPWSNVATVTIPGPPEAPTALAAEPVPPPLAAEPVPALLAAEPPPPSAGAASDAPPGGAAASGRTVRLTWREPVTSRIAGFVVCRAADPAFTAELVRFSLPATSFDFTDDDLRPARSYSYRVAAFNVAGISPFSEPVTITTAP